MKGLKESNIAVIFITHTLHHVYSVADRFLIMSKGKIVKDIKRGEASLDELTEVLMA